MALSITRHLLVDSETTTIEWLVEYGNNVA